MDLCAGLTVMSHYLKMFTPCLFLKYSRYQSPRQNLKFSTNVAAPWHCMYKLVSSQRVIHPLSTENENVTNRSRRISSLCIRHFLPVQHSSEVLRYNSLIAIPIFSCWYSNTTTASDVFCFFVVYMYTKHVTWRDVSGPIFFVLQLFVNTVCFICIMQTATVAVLYFISTILGME